MQPSSQSTIAAAEPRHLARDEIAAQRLACRYLVEGCERSLLELRCSLGKATRPAEVRAGLRAAEVLEGVLLGWRDTLAVLHADPVSPQPTFTRRSPPLTRR